MFPKNLDEDSDEGSNADSDFSGDDNTPAAAGGATAAPKKKKTKKKGTTKKTVKVAKDAPKEKSTPILPVNAANPLVKAVSEPGKQPEGI